MARVLNVDVGHPRPVNTGRRTVPSFVRRFGQASRPGAYLRMVEERELGAEDTVDVDVARLPNQCVRVRLISDAILLDHGLFAQLEAPQLLREREWMSGRSS